jgi:hypothetical protein
MPRKRTKPRNDLSPSYVKALLAYDPIKGELRWKVNRRPRGKRGALAGCRRKDGYLVIGIDGKMYLGHRIAWVIMKGRWPSEQIDHKNENPRDLRWESLRSATHGQNLQNIKVYKSNTSGFKGVYHHSSCARWGAMISVNKKKHHLGLFKTPEEASEAYKKAAKKLHGKFASF